MPPGLSRARWAAAVGLATPLICATSIVFSHPTEVDVARPHATGHVADHADQTWPPQPRGIGHVVDRSEPDVAQSRRPIVQQRFDALERRGAGRSGFGAALGQRFTRIGVADVHDKAGTTSARRFTYFSRSRNETVEVLDDGVDIQSVKATPAAEYQPEITDEEMAEAIQLSRAHFLKLGRTRVGSLKGYAILAYRPEGRGFYDSRVLYVSFHAGDDAPPELLAWVDLTHQTIVKSREERP